MKIEFKEFDFGENGDICFTPVVDGKVHSCYFESKAMALVYAGLVESGLSRNDCTYMSRYIDAMIKGLDKDV